MIKFPKNQVDKLPGQKIYCARVYFEQPEEDEFIPCKVETTNDVIKDLIHRGDHLWLALTIVFNKLKDLNLQFKQDLDCYLLDCHETGQSLFRGEDFEEFHFLSEANCRNFAKNIEKDIKNGECYEDTTEYYYYEILEEFDLSHEYFMPPEVCPSCGEELSMKGEYLNCTNDQCPARVAGAISNWITKLNILEFGDSVINAVIEAGLVKDVGDLYLLDPDKVATLKNNGRYLGESGRKAVINLLNKKEITLEELVGSLGINLWGRSMVKILTDAGYNTLEKLYGLTTIEMTGVKGISLIKAKELCNGLNKNYPLINKLMSNGITIKKNDGHLNGISFCMTGFRDSALQEAIESKGGTIKSSVSKGLTYLIVLDTNSTSSKAEKARSYGTKIINVDEARGMV